MRIGLLSDTHIPEVEKALPPEALQALQGVDLILHAGDIYVPRVLDELGSIAPVLAAEGDDDYGDAITDERVKPKHVLKLEGQTLWLIHERPYFHRFPSQQGTRALAQDKYDAPDIVVFGHEHRTLVQCSGDVLYINPGSPTLLNYRRGLGTVAILTIKSSQADVVILQLMTENQRPTVVSQTSSPCHGPRARKQQRSAEELMQLPDGELELMVAQKVMGWGPAPEAPQACDVDSTGYPCKGQDDNRCSTKGFCSDVSASLELDRRMKDLGWHYELRPAHIGQGGFWGYGIAYSSWVYWVGLAVESPTQIRKAKCAAAILALESPG